MRAGQRGYVDLGPGWFWAAAGCFAVIGVASVLWMIGRGVRYLVEHLAWVA